MVFIKTNVHICAIYAITNFVFIGAFDIMDIDQTGDYVLHKIHPYLPNLDHVSDDCLRQIGGVLQSATNLEMWALKMLDASSKLQSGILKGNVRDYGNFKECLESVGTYGNETIRGKYCLARVITSMQFVVEKITYPSHSAFCIPETCTVKDMNKLFPFLGGHAFTEEYCYSSTEPTMPLSSYMTLALITAIATLAFLSTVYDYIINYQLPDNPLPRSELLLTFSFISNGKKIFASKKDSEQLGCLHGLKALSMMWIIYCHVCLLLIHMPVKNGADVGPLLRKRISMFVISGNFAVDTFLVVGGMLVSYNLMVALASGVKINLPMLYLHRYLRLTPALAVLILIHSNLLDYIQRGPLMTTAHYNYVVPCQDYWWSGLLYLQNYINPNNLCISQSWYLCVDMQLFIVAPFIMMVLYKKPKWGLALLGGLISSSMLITFLVAWGYELPPSLIGHANNLDNRDFMKHYYYPAYTRMSTYLIGMLLGFGIYIIKSSHVIIKMPKILVWVLWIATLSVFLACILGGHGIVVMDTHSRLDNSLYLTFFSPLWAIGLMWLVYACVFDHGGPINTFLSLPVFQVLSKLSYSLYLIHYIYIYLRYALRETPTKIDVFEQTNEFFGTYCMCVVISLIFSLLFESPAIAVERILLKSGRIAA